MTDVADVADDFPTLVIYNPSSGRGRAQNLRKKFVLSNCTELQETKYPGHAESLAYDAAFRGFRKIVAAGGDGTVHECANGLLQAKLQQQTLNGSPHQDIIFTVWPLGSGNDYAFALGLDQPWKPMPNRPRNRCWVDVGRVRAKNKSRFFVNGFGLGINGAVTLESRKIKRLRGMPLYALAILRAIKWHFVQPEISIRFDDTLSSHPTLALTINLGQREGSFPLTPSASLHDGLFNYIHAGPLTRLEFLRCLPGMATGKLPNWPTIRQGVCQHVEIQSAAPFRIHLDGEFFCHPEDQINQCTVELLPNFLQVERIG